MAGQNIFDASRRWTAGFKQNVSASRINTTATLASAIEKAEVKPDVFISMSGVGNTGFQNKKILFRNVPFYSLCLHKTYVYIFICICLYTYLQDIISRPTKQSTQKIVKVEILISYQS